MRACQGVPKRHAYMQALVELLARKAHTGPVRILEVGTWAGGSAITWASALRRYLGGGKVVCVDPWKPYFDPAVDRDPIYEEMNRAAASGAIVRLFVHNVRTSGVGDMIVPVMGQSCDILRMFPACWFSIAYLDGSHRYRDVAEDIELAKSLVREGGFLCGDDLELQGFQVDAGELRRQADTGCDYVRDPATGSFYHPGVTLAVGEAFDEVSVWEGFWAVQNTAGRWARVGLVDCRIEIPVHLTSSAEGAVPDLVQLDDERRHTARLIETYRGFNIVALEDQVWGLRQALGPIDLRTEGTQAGTYPAEDLFACGSVEAVRLKVDLIENTHELRRRVERLEKALEALEGCIQPSIMQRSAPAGPGLPHLIGTYRGFNIVALGDQVWGVRQTLGALDLAAETAAPDRYPAEDLFACVSVDAVRSRIDVFEGLRSVGASLQWRLAEQEQAIAKLLAEAVTKVEAVGRAAATAEELRQALEAERDRNAELARREQELVAERRQATEDVASHTSELERLRKELTERDRALAEDVARREQELAAVRGELEERERALAQLRTEVASKTHDLRRLEEGLAERERHVEELQKALEEQRAAMGELGERVEIEGTALRGWISRLQDELVDLKARRGRDNSRGA